MPRTGVSAGSCAWGTDAAGDAEYLVGTPEGHDPRRVLSGWVGGDLLGDVLGTTPLVFDCGPRVPDLPPVTVESIDGLLTLAIALHHRSGRS